MAVSEFRGFLSEIETKRDGEWMGGRNYTGSGREKHAGKKLLNAGVARKK